MSKITQTSTSCLLSATKLVYKQHYRQCFNISRTQSPNINVSRLVLQLSLPNTLKAREVENEDVVGAVPTGDAPTTAVWSTFLLPTKVRLVLETLRYVPPKWAYNAVVTTYKVNTPSMNIWWRSGQLERLQRFLYRVDMYAEEFFLHIVCKQIKSYTLHISNSRPIIMVAISSTYVIISSMNIQGATLNRFCYVTRQIIVTALVILLWLMYCYRLFRNVTVSNWDWGVMPINSIELLTKQYWQVASWTCQK